MEDVHERELLNFSRWLYGEGFCQNDLIVAFTLAMENMDSIIVDIQNDKYEHDPIVVECRLYKYLLEKYIRPLGGIRKIER